MREEVLKSLKNIYELYTCIHGKPEHFVAEGLMNIEDQNITDGGFELHPSVGYICLYVEEGTFYIYKDNFVFFHNGGNKVNLDNYLSITEEWHFQLSTSNFIAGCFEYMDFPVIREYFDKILLP